MRYRGPDGVQEAAIDGVARAVGINKALIYRHVASKEELFILVLISYLAELRDGFPEDRSDPVAALRESMDRYTAFCLEFPAFLDCALSLMHRPARDLREALSDSVWRRLGEGIASCVVHVSEILRKGARDGAFSVEDPDYMANVLWTQILGATHLARIRVGVRQAAPGIPQLFTVQPEQLARTCVASALATVARSHHPPP